MRTYALPKSERNSTCRRIVKYLPNTSAKLAEILKLRKGTVVWGLRVLRDERRIHIGDYEHVVGGLRPVYFLGKKRDAKRPDPKIAVAASKNKYFENNKVAIYAKRKEKSHLPKTSVQIATETARFTKYREANRELINARARQRLADKKDAATPKTKWVNNSIVQLHKIR